MQPLSGVDNLFLQLEQGNQYMHVAGLGIYDQSTAPGGSVRFKQILDFFSRRLNRSTLFRRRLVVPPLGIDRPYWVEDGEIDVEYHVRHLALPKPGDWRQLMIQIARLHSRPLDRSKPLWEAYVIEGLDNIPGIAKGSFAMYTKVHHAMIDGEAGARLIAMTHSLSPDPDVEERESTIVIADRDPTQVELYARAVMHRGGQLLDAGKLLASLGWRVSQAALEAAGSGVLVEAGTKLMNKAMAPDGGQRAAGRGLGRLLKRKPVTRFDADLSAHRVVDAVGFPLEDCKVIRQQVDDVTINDIFLAACGGAVRRYLAAKNELPRESLTALMPISTRSKEGGGDSGNQMGMVPVPLRSDIADPLARLLKVRRGASASKGASSALGHDFAAKVIQVLPTTAATAAVTHGLVPMCNTTVSNVRGPSVPLYMAGARLQVYLPISIAFNGIGLNMTGFSYNGILWVCFVACRRMLPDPDFFRQCLNESFAEIVDAARKHERAAEKPATKAATAKPRSAKPAAARKPGVAKKPAAARKAATEKTPTEKTSTEKTSTEKDQAPARVKRPVKSGRAPAGSGKAAAAK